MPIFDNVFSISDKYVNWIRGLESNPARFWSAYFPHNIGDYVGFAQSIRAVTFLPATNIPLSTKTSYFGNTGDGMTVQFQHSESRGAILPPRYTN